MTRIILKAKTKPDIKEKGFWYERRDLLRNMYERYLKSEISSQVLMDSFKCDRMKPIQSAYHRMFGRQPKKQDHRQGLMPWAFKGFLEQK